jgi:hypothetical protein
VQPGAEARPLPRRIIIRGLLEQNPRGELDNTGRAGAGDLRQTGGLKVGDRGAGIVQVDVAEGIKGRGTELEAGGTGEREVLEEGEVGVDVGGAVELIILLVAVGSGGDRESRGVQGSLLDPLCAGEMAEIGDVADYVGAVVGGAVEVGVDPGGDGEGTAGLDGGDAVDVPAVEHFAAEEAKVFGGGQFVKVGDDEAVAQVGSGYTVVHSDVVVVDGWAAVVERLGPDVAGEHRELVAEATAEGGLEAVIHAVFGRLVKVDGPELEGGGGSYPVRLVGPAREDAGCANGAAGDIDGRVLVDGDVVLAQRVADIGDVQGEGGAQLLLDGEVVFIYVGSGAAVERNGLDAGSGGGVLEAGSGGIVRIRVGPRWGAHGTGAHGRSDTSVGADEVGGLIGNGDQAEGRLGLTGGVCRILLGVEDAKASAQTGFAGAENIIGESYARREAEEGGIKDALGNTGVALVEETNGGAGNHPRLNACLEGAVGRVPEEGGKDLPAKAEVEVETASNLPVVLGVKGGVVGVIVVVIDVVLVEGVGGPDKKIGEGVARGAPGEGKVAARSGGIVVEQLIVNVGAADLDGVTPAGEIDGIDATELDQVDVGWTVGCAANVDVVGEIEERRGVDVAAGLHEAAEVLSVHIIEVEDGVVIAGIKSSKRVESAVREGPDVG